MIRKIILNNFQSHNETAIELPLGVTAIIGDSDSGKSALFRGIKWFLTGRPVGKEVVRHGEKFCQVSLVLDSGDCVSRCWDNGKNYYLVNGEKKDNFGSSFPEDIKRIVNLTEDNIIEQFNWFSLFYKSPSELAKYFSSIIDLEGIGNTLDYVDKKISLVDSETRLLLKRMSFLEDNIDSFDWIESAEERINDLKDIKEKYYKIKQKKEEFRSIINKNTWELNTTNIISLREKISVGRQLYLNIIKLDKKKEDLNKFICQNRFMEEKKYANNLAMEDIELYKEKNKHLFACCEKRKSYRILYNKIKNVEKKIALLSSESSELKKQFRFKVCPLCGQELK